MPATLPAPVCSFLLQPFIRLHPVKAPVYPLVSNGFVVQSKSVSAGWVNMQFGLYAVVKQCFKIADAVLNGYYLVVFAMQQESRWCVCGNLLFGRIKIYAF